MSFEIPQFSDLVTMWQNTLIAVYGNQLDFDPAGPAGQIVYNFAVATNSIYQLAQAAYSASRVDQAQSTLLDDLVALENIKRSDGEKTVCKSCSLTGTDGTIIPAGSQAKTADGVIFYSSVEVTIAGGLAVVDFISQDYGDFSVAVGQLNAIVTVIVGWDSVTNPNVGSKGSNSETDAQLRIALLNRSQNQARGYPGSLNAVIEGIDGVYQCYVYGNYSDAVSPAPYLIPAHGVLIVIYYDDQTLNPQIAEAIFRNLSFNTTYSSASGGPQITENVIYSGNSVAVNWNKCIETPVNFIIKIIIDTSFTSEDQDNLIATIKQFILDKATIKGTLIYSKIYAAIVDSVPDSNIESVYMSTAPTPTSVDVSDITATPWEIFVTGNIEVDYGS